MIYTTSIIINTNYILNCPINTPGKGSRGNVDRSSSNNYIDYKTIITKKHDKSRSFLRLGSVYPTQ